MSEWSSSIRINRGRRLAGFRRSLIKNLKNSELDAFCILGIQESDPPRKSGVIWILKRAKISFLRQSSSRQRPKHLVFFFALAFKLVIL